MKTNTNHRWTPAQIAFLDESGEPEVADYLTIGDMYESYVARFGRWAASFNQFRTRRYTRLNREAIRERRRKSGEQREFDGMCERRGFPKFELTAG